MNKGIKIKQSSKERSIRMPEIPQNIKEKMNQRNLTLEDVLDNLDLLSNVPIEQYMLPCLAKKLGEALGPCNLQKVLKEHYDVFEHITKNASTLNNFLAYYQNSTDFEHDFTYALRNYYYEHDFSMMSEKYEGCATSYYAPIWMASMNFKAIKTIHFFSDFLSDLTDKTLLRDFTLGSVISYLDVKYMKEFDEKTGFFQHNHTNFLENMYSVIASQRQAKGIHSYQEFCDIIAEALEMYFRVPITEPYMYLKDHFQERYPYLFLPSDAPKELEILFYQKPADITYKLLSDHPEYAPFLVNTHLKSVLNDNNLELGTSPNQRCEGFVDFYTSHFGNENFLQLLNKYGEILDNDFKFKKEPTSKEEFETELIEAIYNLLRSNPSKKYDIFIKKNNTDFMKAHPGMFIKLDEIPIQDKEKKEKFYQSFYSRRLNFGYISDYPELATALKEKDLHILFGKTMTKTNAGKTSGYELIDILGNEVFLDLCAIYGDYLLAIDNNLDKSVVISSSIEELKEEIERIIIHQIKTGEICYNPDDCPSFLKDKHPELFLSEDAPKELKSAYYKNIPDFNFLFISSHPEYHRYLKDKCLIVPLYNAYTMLNKEALFEFFNLFNTASAFQLIVEKPTTVYEMIRSNQVEKMHTWYEATGRKFIPDYIVMQTFPLNEIDKFLANGRTWSKLQDIKRYADTPEHKDVLLKLAYTFGIFEGEQNGLNELKKILNGIPRHISEIHTNKLYFIDSFCKIETDLEIRRESLKRLEQEYHGFAEPYFMTCSADGLYNYIRVKLAEEGFNIDFTKPLIQQIYRQNPDKSCTLTINPEKSPQSVKMIRILFENLEIADMLNSSKAHQLFGNFALTYDKDFRKFLLDNLENILCDTNAGKQIGAIQRQFKAIKTTNSNRILTWELAVDYVGNQEYKSAELGNEAMAEIASIAGYSEEDFAILQQIYNYSKQRIFSSIPRIESQKNGYTYEILRLDDPLALAIGTLTDCCQEIGNAAELCVEHSMVDQNGRIFVVKDKEGNIVAQSWVWRNNNVLCFDNVEVPKKAFLRATREDGYKNKEEFTDEIFAIYKQAAKELIAEDELHYQKLLKEDIISRAEYEATCLRSVTVGIGYNDIAESIKRNATKIKKVTHPLPFAAPVKLNYGLWTNDSMTQYLLEGLEEQIISGPETLPIYHDAFKIYDKSNFNLRILLALQRLELLARPNNSYPSTQFDERAYNDLFTGFANNYSCNPENTRVLMTQNFAIIYEEDEEQISIVDLFCNTKTEHGTIDLTDNIMIQMKLTLIQISENKKVDISALEPEAQELFNTISSITQKQINDKKGLTEESTIREYYRKISK